MRVEGRNQMKKQFLIVFIIFTIGLMMFTQAYASDDGHYVGQVEITCGHDSSYFYGIGHTTARTCLEWGRTIIDCSDRYCKGQKIKYNVPPQGHIFGFIGNTTRVVEPTCTTEGYTITECDAFWCYQKIKKDIKEPLGHDFDGIEKDATCIEYGQLFYICNRCGAKYGETIPKCDHEWYEDYVEGTCTGQVGYWCDRCAHCNVIANKRIDIHCRYSHQWSEDTEILEKPTCLKGGSEIKTCTLCGEQRKADLPKDKTKHNFPDTPADHHPVSCEDNGYDIFYCTLCGEKETVVTEDAYGLPHTYKTVNTVAATCTQDGTITQECTKCSHLNEITIPANGHRDSNKDGDCDVCGAEVDLDIRDIVGKKNKGNALKA